MAFNIERVPNQASKPAVLLRQAWREGARIRKKTIANLFMLPDHVVEGFRTVLKGGVTVGDLGDLVTVEHSLAHGHVMAVLGVERLLHRHDSRPARTALTPLECGVYCFCMQTPTDRPSPDNRVAPAKRTTNGERG